VAGYVTIKSYEEWSKQSEGARTPTFSERGRTPMSEKGNITPLEQTFDTTIVNETDASESVSANRAPAEDKTGTNGPNIINGIFLFLFYSTCCFEKNYFHFSAH